MVGHSLVLGALVMVALPSEAFGARTRQMVKSFVDVDDGRRVSTEQPQMQQKQAECKANIFLLGGSSTGKGTLGRELTKNGYQGFEVDEYLFRKGAVGIATAIAMPEHVRRNVYTEAAALPGKQPFFINESSWWPNAFDTMKHRKVCKVYVYKQLALLWNHVLQRNQQSVDHKTTGLGLEVRPLHVVMNDIDRFATLTYRPCNGQPFEKVRFLEASAKLDKAQQDLHVLAKKNPEIQHALMYTGPAMSKGYNPSGDYPPLRTYVKAGGNQTEWLYICPKPGMDSFKKLGIWEGHSEPSMLASEIQSLCSDMCEE